MSYVSKIEMNSAEKNPSDVAFFNTPTDRLDGVLRNVSAALTARENNFSHISRTTNNASVMCNFSKKSKDESSEEEDFKSPENTVRRMRKSEKLAKIDPQTS
ncbi:hypothetical protein HHI36_001744 [Cryptolaemus montrouzieri]|uniref:Uncharacterized protein n=1 Tax=Cryptolaemus montrouzieri TaxID=559131 RepID=A0ABD2P8H9_9CUCU